MYLESWCAGLWLNYADILLAAWLTYYTVHTDVGVSGWEMGSSIDNVAIGSSVKCLSDVVDILVVSNLRTDLGETNKG